MSQPALPPPLQTFVDQVHSTLDSISDEANFLPRVGEAMRQLVANDDWLDDAFAREHPRYYQQYLLYAAPDDRFSVVSFVWGPGQTTPVHDHTVWGVVGVLRGTELCRNFEPGPDGAPPVPGDAATLNAGEVAFVSPRIGDVHKVSNALSDRVSISIHAYGANIGKVQRHVFPAEGGVKDFISGYANAE